MIHCAGIAHQYGVTDEAFNEINHLATLNLAIQARDAQVKKFIFFSSIKVNGDETAYDEIFSNESDLKPSNSYGQSKLMAEVGLTKIFDDKSHCQLVILRLPLIYGIDVKGNFLKLKRLVQSKIPLPTAALSENSRAVLSIVNLFELIKKCIETQKKQNMVLFVRDKWELSTRDILSEIAKSVEVNDRQFYIPQAIVHCLLSIFFDKTVSGPLLGSQKVCIEQTKTTVGWEPLQLTMSELLLKEQKYGAADINEH